MPNLSSTNESVVGLNLYVELNGQAVLQVVKLVGTDTDICICRLMNEDTEILWKCVL